MEGKLVYDDFSEEFRNWLSEEEPEPDYGLEVKKGQDNVLQEELVDRLTFVNLIEEAQDTDFCAAENAYLALLDNCLELAKIVHPMAGFGADRLNMCLGILQCQ